MVRGVPCMCMSTTAHPLSAAAHGILSSPRKAVTSLMISAPAAAAARATAAFEVSTLRAAVVFPASFSITGMTRRSSSSTVTAAAPGRVDSPPMSRMSAPSSARRRAWATASSVRAKWPPSEKESGVTLTMPMISPRSARSKVRRLVRQIMPSGCGRNVRARRVPPRGRMLRPKERTSQGRGGRVRPDWCGAGIGRR